MSRTAPAGCGCAGCRGPADARISYKGEERVVCADHIDGHRVEAWFGGVEQ